MQRKNDSWKKIYIFSILKICGNDVSKLKMTLAFVIYMMSTDGIVLYADMNVIFFPAIIFYRDMQRKYITSTDATDIQ